MAGTTFTAAKDDRNALAAFKLNLALTEFLAAYAENDTDSRWPRPLTIVKDGWHSDPRPVARDGPQVRVHGRTLARRLLHGRRCLDEPSPGHRTAGPERNAERRLRARERGSVAQLGSRGDKGGDSRGDTRGDRPLSPPHGLFQSVVRLTASTLNLERCEALEERPITGLEHPCKSGLLSLRG